MTKAVIVAISLTEDSSSDNTGNINGSQMLMEVQKICVAYVKPALIWILMFFPMSILSILIQFFFNLKYFPYSCLRSPAQRKIVQSGFGRQVDKCSTVWPLP